MRRNNEVQFKAVVIGVSSGGVSALKLILGELPADFPIPVLVVTHITPDSGDGLAILLDTLCAIRVKEADEQELMTPGTVYLAPANYHLMVERGGVLSLSIDPPVNFARPSVDVLFDSAAEVYGAALIGAILTGAGHDGSRGMLSIKERGGMTIVQEPADAEVGAMPENVLKLLKPDHVVELKQVSTLLMQLVRYLP